jgi:hypothetical protein
LEDGEPPMDGPRRPVPHPAGGALGPEGRWREAVAPLTWGRALVLVALFGLMIVSYKSCQQAQVRLTKGQAIARARAAIDFAPERTQVRLVRQGLKSRPFWAISFSIPAKRGDGYERLTTVRVDANTGKLAAVNRVRGRQPAGLP